MLHHHHTLISTSPPFLSSSSSAAAAPLNHHSFNEEASMEVALKASSRAEALSSGQQHEEAAWAVERSGVLGDEFSVDDLLDFGGLTDIEEDEGEQEEGDTRPKSSSSSSSALSFEPAPPSEIALPADDVAELEWVSHFVEESFSDFPPPCPATSIFNPLAPAPAAKPRAEPAAPAKRAAACVLLTEASVPVKAKRSKRSRAPGWVRSMPIHAPLSEASSSISSSSSSCASSTSSSCVVLWTGLAAPPKPKRKRGRKPKPPPRTAPCSGSGGAVAVGDRRCSHCGAQKTPQWRAGPEGAKTLCNACGVRFKSGRLFPEYRPACSPSFLSHVHSNSHRKVLEMRRKKADLGLLAPSGASVAATAPSEPARSGSAVHFGVPARP